MATNDHCTYLASTGRCLFREVPQEISRSEESVPGYALDRPRPWFSRSYLTDLVAMGRETSSLRSHPYNVLASPLCHSSHQSTPSGVGRFPGRNVATVENSRYASRKLERAKDSIRKARSPRPALQRSADGGALTRKPGVLDTPTSSTLTTMSLLVAAASA